MKKLLAVINICPNIARHLIGEGHTPAHCCVIGGIMIFLGTRIANVHFSNFLANIGTEAIGYIIHGVGATPFIDAFLKTAK